MGQEWYMAKDGNKLGPFSSADLKHLADNERLQPTDLVWTQGMSKWKEARKVVGLFPDQAVTEPTPPVPSTGPPPLPVQSQPVVSKPAPVQMQPVVPQQPPETTPAGALGLWNPKAVRWWSLLFTWVFGSILMAKNWRALGQPDRARRLMIWCYASIPYALLGLFTPDTPFWTKSFRYVSLGILVVWINLEAMPQINFVKKHIGENYRRRPWRLPLGIAGAILGLCVIGFIVSEFDEDDTVQVVRTGFMQNYPGSPVGKAIDHFLSKPTWESGVTKTGQHVVTVRGGMTYQDKPVRATIQFIVNKEARTFEFHAFELNDIPQNDFMKHALMEKIFEDFRKGEAPRPADQDRQVEQTASRTTLPMKRTDFKSMVIGLTKDQVVAKIGRPQDTSELGGMEIWQYSGITYDPLTNKSDFIVALTFQQGRVTNVQIP